MALDNGEGSSLSASWPPSITLDEAILVAQDQARRYQEARDLLRKLAVSRDCYPVIVRKEDVDRPETSGTGSSERGREREHCRGGGRGGNPGKGGWGWGFA